MGEVIRPDFHGKSGDTRRDGPDPVFKAVHIFGEAARYGVYLIHDVAAPHVGVFKVVVGQVSSEEADAVANLSATTESKAEALTIGLAILRTLKLIESIGNGPPV